MTLVQKLSYYFIAIILALAVIAPSLEKAFDSHSESASQSHHESQSCAYESCLDKPDQEVFKVAHSEEDCHCPLHRTTCGHSTTVMMATVPSEIFYLMFVTSNYSQNYSVKAGPFLEGPFQPPRV